MSDLGSERSSRGLRRYVDDLLTGRRPRRFPADDEEASQAAAAITLRAARPGSSAPSEEFLAGLRRRLAAQIGEGSGDAPAAAPQRATRRRVVQVAAAAATTGAVGGAALDQAIAGGGGKPAAGDATLSPNTGTWHTVAATAELPDGTVRGFDAGTVIGFVERRDGQLRAISGICSHQGCHLALDSPTRELTCPCHRTAFSLAGDVVRHQLKVAPAALPRLSVREVDGAIQIFAP